MSSPSTQIIVKTIQDELGAMRVVLNEKSTLEICDYIEQYVVEKIRSVFFIELEKLLILEKKQFKKISVERIAVNNIVYEYKSGQSINKPTLFQVQLKQVYKGELKFKSISLKKAFDSVGRYSSVQINTVHEFDRNLEILTESIKLVFETSYRWLLEFVREAVEKIQDETASSCNSVIRTLFGEKIAENIFLWKVSKDRGVYLVDQLTLRSALTRAKKRDGTTQLSPIEIISNFATTSTDLNKVAAKIAIQENKIIHGDFSVTDYSDTRHDQTETIIYQSRSFAAQPLVRDGEYLLIAGYPSELRQTVEMTLANEKDRFRDIISSGKKKVTDVESLLGERTVLSDVSEFQLEDKIGERLAKRVSHKLKIPLTGIEIDLTPEIQSFLIWMLTREELTLLKLNPEISDKTNN